MKKRHKKKPDLLDVRLIGDKVLRQTAKEVTEITPEIKSFIENLVHTMYERDGAGLAAPQVGVSLRIFAVDTQWAETQKKQPMVFINPKLYDFKGEAVREEGCISLPGVFGEVARAEEVTIEAIDINGAAFKINAKGFFAVALQHEYDHLDGKLFVDRMPKLKKVLLNRKIRQIENKTDENGENIMKEVYKG